MQHHALLAKLSKQGNRFTGLCSRYRGIVPTRRFEGEKLGQIANRSTADSQCLYRIGERSWLTNHEITQMGLNWHRLGQHFPVFRTVQHRAGFSCCLGSPL